MGKKNVGIWIKIAIAILSTIAGTLGINIIQ